MNSISSAFHDVTLTALRGTHLACGRRQYAVRSAQFSPRLSRSISYQSSFRSCVSLEVESVTYFTIITYLSLQIAR